ncbi:hypothetical protein Tco_0858537 [Tanacetum coccineum]|uniref:Uncharacterized protein n=1 Tax=Tanacetum coccineum TaxID=301880 RepID=A0ABQ5B9J3_9ASTR
MKIELVARGLVKRVFDHNSNYKKYEDRIGGKEGLWNVGEQEYLIRLNSSYSPVFVKVWGALCQKDGGITWKQQIPEMEEKGVLMGRRVGRHLVYWEIGKKGEGVRMYKRAAELDDPAEQCNLGISYLQELDRLKQTLLEHVKEKEYLMQTVTLLKNDFKKEESSNIDREIALEKKIKQLDNIKAQQLKPKLYDGNVIKNTSAIVIPDSEETLMLAEENHPNPSDRPTKVEVLKELPKVNMINTSLKKLKHHLAGFNVVVKERTTNTAITELVCLKLKTELLNKKDFIEKETYDKLFRSFTTLEKHCISLEVDTQLNQENFHRENSVSNQKMLKIDVETLNPRLLNNRSTHFDYLKHTQEEAVILREIVELGKSQHPLNNSLDSACKYTKQIQELLIIIKQTCPSINNSGDKLVAVTPKNKDKRVRFTEPVTSSGNTHPKTDSSSNLVSNKPALSSTGVRPSTSASGSQPSGNTKNDKIQRPSSSTLKNKVEAHPRTVKSSLKNKNSVVEPKGTANVQHSKLNANSELLCVKCNGCIFFDIHDLCVLDFINDVNARAKSKSVKKSSKRKVWKPTGKVFTNIGYTWRPTGRTFTIVENACPLTRITTTTEVPLRKPTALKSDTPKPVVTLVYSRKLKKSKTNVPIFANNKEPSISWGSIVSDVPSSSLDECRLSKLFSDI